MSELDPNKIQQLMTKMVMNLLQGNTDQQSYVISVTIPIAMAEVIEYVAESYAISVEDCLSMLASEGIGLKLQQSLKEGLAEAGMSLEDVSPTKDMTNDPLKTMGTLGIDTSKVQSSLDQLTQLSEQIQQMTKVLTDALPIDSDINKDKENI